MKLEPSTAKRCVHLEGTVVIGQELDEAPMKALFRWPRLDAVLYPTRQGAREDGFGCLARLDPVVTLPRLCLGDAWCVPYPCKKTSVLE